MSPKNTSKTKTRGEVKAMNTDQQMLVPQIEKSGTELTYPLLNHARMKSTLALIEENLGNQNFSIQNLPKIRVPSGGTMAFRVTTASGDEELVKLIEGVIVATRAARVFWENPFGSGAGKRPPDCTSNDGYIGTGRPGGECARCPNAAFGTALNPDGSRGKGQACKQVQQILFLLPDALLPHLLSVPPTSGKNFAQYTLTMLSAGAAYWTAVTKLSIEKATSSGGIDFGRIVFRMGKRLNASEQATLDPYHQRMRELLKPSVVDTSAYEIVQENSEPESSPDEPASEGADNEIPF